MLKRLLLGVTVCLVLSGCKMEAPPAYEAPVSTAETPEVEVVPAETPADAWAGEYSYADDFVAVVALASDVIIGCWEISYAADKETNEEYPLQHLYGTGIRYGGGPIFNPDGTFGKYIGITAIGDDDSHEGTYVISGHEITLSYRDGDVETAVYLPDSHEIRIEKYPFLADGKTICEYFVKLE